MIKFGKIINISEHRHGPTTVDCAKPAPKDRVMSVELFGHKVSAAFQSCGCGKKSPISLTYEKVKQITPNKI